MTAYDEQTENIGMKMGSGGSTQAAAWRETGVLPVKYNIVPHEMRKCLKRRHIKRDVVLKDEIGAALQCMWQNNKTVKMTVTKQADDGEMSNDMTSDILAMA